MKEYRIVAGDSENGLDSFSEAVSEWLQQGWKCVGGIAVRTCGEGCAAYYQAMQIEMVIPEGQGGNGQESGG